MVVLFVNENDFFYYRNCLYNHRYKFSFEKEHVNESHYIVCARTRFGSTIRVGLGMGA